MGYDDDRDKFVVDDEYDDDADYVKELEDSLEDGVSFCTFLAIFGVFRNLFDHFLYFSGKSR